MVVYLMQIVVYPYNKMLLRNKKEPINDAHNYLNAF